MKSINFRSTGKGISLALIFVTLILYFPLLVWGLDVPTITTWTNVSGFINSDTTWTLEGSPYIVTGNVMVLEGVALTIEPGVTVKFDTGKILQVNGTLIARGTSENRVTFTSNKTSPAPSDWGYVSLTDTSSDATFDINGNYIGGSIIEYCIFEYGGEADGELRIENCSPYISKSIFRKSGTTGIWLKDRAFSRIVGNSVINNGSNGIDFYNNYNKRLISSAEGGTISIIDNEVRDNSGFGIDIFSLTIYISHDLNGIIVEIKNNQITGNGGGISLYVYGTITVLGNIVQNNRGRASALDGRGGSPFTISKNIFYNNEQGLNIGGGTFIFTNNIMADNSSSAVHMNETGNSDVRNNQILRNMASTGSALSSNFGSGEIEQNLFAFNRSSASNSYTLITEENFSGSLSNNNIFGNAGSYELYNAKNSVSPSLNAKNNWWGTTNDAEIQAKIYDWFDDGTKGVVDYLPFLTSPDTNAPISPPSNVNVTVNGNIINLTWSPNPESDLKGYKVYWDTKGQYPFANSVDVGNVTGYALTGLPSGTYYVAVTAYDTDYDPAHDDPATIINENQTNGNESWYSTLTLVTNTYTLNVTKTGSGTGTVTSSPVGIDCGSDCSEIYTYNSSVILTAQPSTGLLLVAGLDVIMFREINVL